MMIRENGRKTSGGNRSIDFGKNQSDYNINLPFLHPKAAMQAKLVGCQINTSGFTGTQKQIESFMKIQNTMFQGKYNGSKYLNGAWNPLGMTLEMPLPKAETGTIIMSASTLRMDKSVSTGFMPVVYDDFDQLGEAMHQYAHSSAIYSPIYRWDKYSGKIKMDFRRRQHNISFVGNVLAYDFDDGTLSFADAISILRENELEGLVIRSKSDPKYDYDRFKILLRTNFFFPFYQRDEAPEGFQKVPFGQYRDVYIGFAKKLGLWKYADHSTIDPSRLIAQVNNSDFERREYVAV